MIKECKKHGLTEFSPQGKEKRNRCKKCIVEAVQRRRQKIKLLAIEYKGGGCERCSYNKCVAALEFHHLNPNEKDFAIGNRGNCKSWAKIKAELDKCILVCSNCHREIHNES